MVMAILRLFWEKGIDRVSPGAYGMVLRGKPFSKEELKLAVCACPGITWDGDWIVKETNDG